MTPDRRRAGAAILTASLSIAAVCAGAARGRPSPRRRVSWSGQLMGATASMTLDDADPAAARATIALCLAEIERLEQIFSLMRPDSELSRLNRRGELARPSLDMLRLIDRSQRLSALSDGGFDLSVQPLWTLYSGHFARLGPDAAGPAPEAIARALASVGWRDIEAHSGAIRLRRPHMGLTFNSIARGYATDRVGDILRNRGYQRVLIDLDAYLGLGPRPDGTPWRIGIADPAAPERVIDHLDIVDRAVASAGGYGTCFDRRGLFHHIFDPRSGACAQNWAGATVVARSATIADALSTALLVVPEDRAARLLAEAGGEKAALVGFDGRILRLG